MSLPRAPQKRFAGRFAPPARQSSTPERLRRLVEKHEEEERPFDPEKRGSWRGGGRELVVNPNQFQKDLAELIERWSRTLHDPDNALAEAKRILKEGGRPDQVMRDLDELLETHGVESIPGMQSEILYLNTGDTYEPTILYSYDEDKYFISDWGTLVEEASSEAEEDAWGDWLEREVRSDLTNAFESRYADNEKLLDRLTDALDELDSDELKALFWRMLSNTGGEYVHESDGSVFVSGQEKATSALADTIVEKASAVPEQESFGFNRRQRNAAAIGGLRFIAILREQTGPVQGYIAAAPPSGTGQLFVNFYNIPVRSEPRARAELENNRMMFTVSGFGSGQSDPPPSGKVKIEQTMSALPREYRLRQKTGTPEQIALYLADFLNKISAQVPPKYTHSRAPNARAARGIWEPGTKVRLSSKFLKSTGQGRGQDAHSTWKVIEDRSDRGSFVLVNEEWDTDRFTEAELRADPSLKWRRFAKSNLVVAGKPDYSGV